MRKSLFAIMIVMLLVPLSAVAGLKRIDISPMVLINLDEDRPIDSDSRLIGGAVAGDFYFSRHFAIRTTVGYVRNLYNTSVSRIDRLFGDLQPLEDPNYSLRFSLAPYADANLGGILRPYVSFSGGVGYLDHSNYVGDIRAPQAEALSNAGYATTSYPGGGYYDFTGAIGMKVSVYGNVSVFGEISHRFYSSLTSETYYSPDATYRLVPFGFDQYDTMLSVGASYSIGLGDK